MKRYEHFQLIYQVPQILSPRHFCCTAGCIYLFHSFGISERSSLKSGCCLKFCVKELSELATKIFPMPPKKRQRGQSRSVLCVTFAQTMIFLIQSAGQLLHTSAFYCLTNKGQVVVVWLASPIPDICHFFYMGKIFGE